jgi:hypothetical protein
MSALHSDAFDPKAYPRTYGISISGKWLLFVLGLVLFSIGCSGAIYFAMTDGVHARGSEVFVIFSAGFALLGVYLFAVATWYRVVLQADSIETFEVHRRRQMARRDIEGRSHVSSTRGPATWVLVPKPGFGRKIQLSSFLKTDGYFRGWMLSLPDLDAGKRRDAARERSNAIAALKQRGFNELAIERLSHFARGLNWAVYGVGIASFFISNQLHLLIWMMIALPWAAILLVAVFRPYYRFGGPRNSPLPDLSMMLLIPGAWLTLHALQNIAPIGWRAPLSLTAIGSLILVGAALWVDPWLQRHRGTAVLLLFIGCGYGYGAGLQVNALLDGSAPQAYRVLVVSRHVSHGKSTSYHLQLAPWGPNVGGQDLMVSPSRYAQTRPGDSVCMLLRPGALNVAWSELGQCDSTY